MHLATCLPAHGYDGLYCPGECACANDDLMPCGEMAGELFAAGEYACRPGYRHPAPTDDEYDWYIGPNKPSKEAEK